MRRIEAGIAFGAKAFYVDLCWTFGGICVNETALN
jgi:hypothetical protein